LAPDLSGARAIAVALFIAGLLFWIRVMFFGVRRDVGMEHTSHRAWPLGLAVALVTAGILLYARPSVTPVWVGSVSLLGLLAGGAAWWATSRSAALPSDDPEDDPRYRFQGHVARVTQAFTNGVGRIAFSYEGKRIELGATWSPESGADMTGAGRLEDEVVIERVDGDIAYVEPWATVEQRL
jgi:membrane protein implicated in regulation of membrane protease activity